MARRPAPTEYAGWFDRYVRLVEDVDDLAETMARQLDETMAWYRGLSEAQVESRYAPDKWTIKEVIGHMADTERVMQYRALGVARGDAASFPLVRAGRLRQDLRARRRRTWTSLLDEFKCVRQSSIHLFRHLDEASLDRLGSVNSNPTTARAIGYVIVGHERHHLAILKDKYVARPPARAAARGRRRRQAIALPLRPPRQAGRQDPLQQRLVADAGLVGRLREVLAVGDLRVRVGLEHADAAVVVEPQVDARVAAQLERRGRRACRCAGSRSASSSGSSLRRPL